MKNILYIFILFALLLYRSESQNCSNLYLNNTANVSDSTGTLLNSFQDLYSAFAVIKQNCSNESVILNVVTTS